MRERLLVRHFLWCFLEHDLVSPNTDRRMVLSTVAGGLAAISLIVMSLIAQQYLFFSHMPPGVRPTIACSREVSRSAAFAPSIEGWPLSWIARIFAPGSDFPWNR